MNIIALTQDHKKKMKNLLSSIDLFNAEEIDVVNELLDIYFENKKQKDYLFFASEEASGEFSSFICFGPTPMTKNTYDLYWIGTNPNYRGRGLAASLIKHMKEIMYQNKARLIRVETSSKELYAGTQEFYYRLKFVEAARIKDFYQDGDDLITYIMNTEN